MTCNVAFIGLGVMGYPMAGYISKGGHNVTVFNRTKSKAEKWIKDYKGKMAETPAEAAKDAEFIFTCVGNDNDLREVTFGDNGVFKTIKEGSVYIDNTTASATIAREIYDYAKKNNFGALDAPVSGGEPGAIEGTLAIMTGGSSSDFERSKPVFDVLGGSSVLCGEVGAGNFTKLANQMIVGANIHILAEALTLTTKAGLDPETVFNAIKGGLAGSNVMNTKAPMMYERNFKPGFRIELHLKDITNAMETANEMQIPLQVTSNLHQVLKSLVLDGKGVDDNSGILKFVEKQSGVEVKK